MADISTIIKTAAMAGHRVVCPDDNGCPGPSELDQLVAGTIIAAALPHLFGNVNRALGAAVGAMEAGQFDAGPPDATATTADELLRQWFHWWRTAEDTPQSMPQALHVSTVAFLAAGAVQAGRTLHGPSDV